MSLDKAIKHGKEHRKPYAGSKSFDYSCVITVTALAVKKTGFTSEVTDKFHWRSWKMTTKNQQTLSKSVIEQLKNLFNIYKGINKNENQRADSVSKADKKRG